MSDSLQYKLANQEINPPEGVWERISKELDDAGSGSQFPQRLKEFAVAPPATAWGKIAQQLDAASDAHTLAEKLYSAEVIPPAGTWTSISEALDETSFPQRRRVTPFWRYAAAAVILGFLAFGATQLLDTGNKETGTAGNTEKNTPVIEAISHATDGIDAASDDAPVEINSSDDQEARNDAALEASKQTYARLNISPAKKADIDAAFRVNDYMDPEEISGHSLSGYEEALTANETGADRYILLMTPDGHFIRVSKKLANLVCCVSGEEQDRECRIMVDNWRKQLACSDVSHPGNFMDILSLVSSLQDN